MSKKTKPENTLKKNILEDTEALATAIEHLEEVGLALAGSRLKKKAILVLLSHYTGLSQDTIDLVMTSLTNIRKTYLK